ncbi:hypothetical protein ACQP2Y_33135 [Actinoplanes sp. CA-051413]|uniref:hypothetical protein n=1 Tax=Actinoplanes sp. CA-051413 TaxID=3239899 RepID=UPI003D952ED0
MNRSWREALRQRVARQCGEPDEHFAGYGHKFGDWIDAAPGAGQPAFVEVEAGVAGYLGVAARTGSRWGTTAGLVLGSGAAVLSFLVVWMAG